MVFRPGRNGSINQTLQQYDAPRRQSGGDTIREVIQKTEFEPGDAIIPDYLEPIGDSGFFITPSEPADPTDCQRYPNSPFCGGTGVDFDSILDLSPISIDPSISFNNCEVCLISDASLFWISLPQNQICYRAPGASCYQDPPYQPPPPDPPDPPPPPGMSPTSFTPWPGGGGSAGCPCGGRTSVFNTWVNFDGSLGINRPGTLGFGSFGPPLGWETRTETRQYLETEYFESFEELRFVYIGVGGFQRSEWLSAEYRTNRPVFHFQTKLHVYGWQKLVNSCNCPKTPSRNTPPPYQPPPPKNCKKCMSNCCNPKDNQEILDLLKRIAARLGTQDYPIKTPRWLVTNQGGGDVTHQSLTQFNFWLMRQLDALIGEFPISVEIEDSDPTTAGQQKKQIKLYNLAESLAEIYGLSAKTAIDSDVHTSFLMRLAAETMAAKTAALIAQDYASANASFLGYKGNQVKRDVQFSFDPTKLDSLETILNASNQQILGWQNEDRESVVEYLQKIMFSAGLIKTVFFRKGSDLQRILKEVKEFLPDPKAEDSEGWKEFIRLINNPDSPENKDTDRKPKIENLPKPPQNGGR